jgi:hypothetical protein
VTPLAFVLASFVAAQTPAAAPSPAAPPCPANADAAVLTLVEPGPVHLESAIRVASSKKGEVFVTIGADGKNRSAAMYRSTGSTQLDQALLRAAVATTYSPAIVDCKPIVSKYDYRLTFAPYPGDNTKDDARFQAFVTTLLATGQAPIDAGVRLDPKLSSAQALHDVAQQLSALGAFHSLHFFDDDVVGGVHRFHFSARFEKGKADVVFWVEETGAIVGFTRK